MAGRKYPPDILDQAIEMQAAWSKIDEQLSVGGLKIGDLVMEINQIHQTEANVVGLEQDLTNMRKRRPVTPRRVPKVGWGFDSQPYDLESPAKCFVHRLHNLKILPDVLLVPLDSFKILWDHIKCSQDLLLSLPDNIKSTRDHIKSKQDLLLSLPDNLKSTRDHVKSKQDILLGLPNNIKSTRDHIKSK